MSKPANPKRDAEPVILRTRFDLLFPSQNAGAASRYDEHAPWMRPDNPVAEVYIQQPFNLHLTRPHTGRRDDKSPTKKRLEQEQL